MARWNYLDRTDAMWKFREDVTSPTKDATLDRMRRVSCWSWRAPVLALVGGIATMAIITIAAMVAAARH